MMVEWHVTPDYIASNWTDELLNLMVEKMAERKERENNHASANRAQLNTNGKQVVSDTMLFSQAHNLIKVEKKHGD